MKIFSSILLLLMAFSMNAQRILQPKLVELDLKGVIYKKEWSFDFRLHENGYAVAYNTGEVLSYKKSKYYQLELGLLKDIRERRQNKNYSFNPVGGSRAFVFGKINTFMTVRGSIGFKHYVSEKAKRKGLAVGYSYSVGPAVGLLKPYYLNLIYRPTETNEATDYRDERFTEQNAEKFLNFNDINGASSFFEGITEIKVIPGVQAKVASHFALGAFDEYVKAVELGLMADLYIRRIDLMAPSAGFTNKPYFIKLFANIQLGMRKN